MRIILIAAAALVVGACSSGEQNTPPSHSEMETAACSSLRDAGFHGPKDVGPAASAIARVSTKFNISNHEAMDLMVSGANDQCPEFRQALTGIAVP